MTPKQWVKFNFREFVAWLINRVQFRVAWVAGIKGSKEGRGESGKNTVEAGIFIPNPRISNVGVINLDLKWNTQYVASKSPKS